MQNSLKQNEKLQHKKKLTKQKKKLRPTNLMQKTSPSTLMPNFMQAK